MKIQSILFEAQFNTPSPSALVSHQPRDNSVSQSGKNQQAEPYNYEPDTEQYNYEPDTEQYNYEPHTEPYNYEPDNDSNSKPFYNRTLFRLQKT